MINDNKYVGFEKASQPIIKNIGANNVDVYIDENGEYEAKAPFTGFGKVIVNVPNRPDEAPSGWIPREVVNGKVEQSSQLPNFEGITNVGNYVFKYAFYRNNNITGKVDLSSLTKINGTESFYYAYSYDKEITEIDLSNLIIIEETAISCFYYAFAYDDNITSVNISKLKNINASNAFAFCFYGTGITEIDFSALESIQGRESFRNTFNSCSELVSINFSNLEIVEGTNAFQGAFYRCNKLKNTNFNKLKRISGNCFNSTFGYCESLEELYFPALELITDTSFKTMLNGCDGVTVHFPANRQSSWENLSDFLNGFGGTNTTILWDL